MSARLSKSGPLRGERRRRLARSSTGGPETMRGGSSSRKHRGVRPPGPPRRPVVAFADAPQSPTDMVGGGGALSQQQLQQQHLGGGRYSPVVLPQQQRGAGAGGGRPPVGMGHAAARRRKMAGPGSGGDGQPVGFSAGGTPAQWAERVRGPPPGSPGSGRLEPLENAPQARKLPSFLRNLLRDDLGQLRLDVDLEVHAMTSGVPVTNATVQEVCELDPMVQRLTLRNCYAVSDAGLWAVARACTSITSLNLSGLSEISHVGLRAVTLRCRNLAELDVSKCAGVHDLAMRVLAAGCWALTDLNLHGSKAITDAGISELVQCCKRLESLNLSQIPGVADTCLFELGKYCSSLRRLNLGHCTYIKDAGVAAVAAGCPFLSYLRVSHCPDFTSKGMAVLSKRSKYLETLHVAGCKRIKGNDVGVVLKGCRRLTELNIRECPNVREAAFRALAKYGDVLKVLNLRGLAHVVGNTAVSRVGAGCVALRDLDVSECPRVANKGLRNLVMGCSRLTTLRLDGCHKCTKPFVQAIAAELPFVEFAEGWYGLQALEDAEERIRLTELRREQVAAAVAMQRLWRGTSARQQYEAMRLRARQEIAAVSCQKVVRGWMGRRVAYRRKAALNMEEAALVLQCAWRGYKGRCKMARRRRLWMIRQNQNLAATMIQALWRGYCGRLEYERRRMVMFRRLQEESAEKSKRDRAARVIQGNYRIHMARVFMDRLKLAVKEAARVYAIEDRAARKLQRIFRGHTDRQKVVRLRAFLAQQKMMQDAALRIQCCARRYFAYNVANELRRLAQERLEYRSIRLLQRVWRGSRGRHIMAVMRSLEQLRQLEAAAVLKIQGRWRVFKAKRFLKSLKATAEAVKRRLDAAVTIQRMWRGAMARADAEALRALAKVEGVAAPLRAQIAELEKQRSKIQSRFLQSRKRVQEGERLLKDWGEELVEVNTIKAKWYDSAKISGVPQRYKTSFLRQALNTHIADMTRRMVVFRKKLTESAVDLRDVDRLLRAKRRELKPLEEDVEARARMSRDKRLKERVLLERWAASKIQAVFRGRRVREAMAAGQNNWVELWDEASGYYYYYNTATQRNSWMKPVDFQIYGDAKAQPTHSGWTRYYDEEMQKEYFYNVHSGEYRWEQPDDFYAEPTLRDPDTLALRNDDATEAPSYEWLATQDKAALTARSKKGTNTIGDWTEYVDEASGAKYYVHNVTGEARWSLSPQSARGLMDAPDADGQPVPPVAPSTQPPEYATREATMAEHPSWYGEDWWAAQNMEALSARSERTGWFDDWNEYYDKESQALYYYNPSTGQSSWTVPEAIADQVARREEIEAERERARQAKIYNEAWFDAQDKQALTERSDRQRQVNDWVEYKDPESGAVYYYNEQTGETSWDPPPDVHAYDEVITEYEAKDDMEFDAEATARLQELGVIKKERIQAGVLGWVPPAPIKEEDSDDDDIVAITRAGSRPGTAGSRPRSGRKPTSARSDTGRDIWPDVNELPRALRAKIKRIEREYATYPDRDVHVAFLQKQLKANEWLMSSGIADQILTLQRRAAETAARIKTRAEIKEERMLDLARKRAAETKARLEAEEQARLDAEEAARRQAQAEKEAKELAEMKEAKLKAKAEREAKERAEAEQRAKEEAEAKAFEEARLAREWAWMRQADKEAQDERAMLEKVRAEKLAKAAEEEAARMREEAEKAAEAAENAQTEKDLLESQMEALRERLRAAEDAKEQAEAEKEEALLTVAAVTEAAPMSPSHAPAGGGGAQEPDPWVPVDDGAGNVYYYNNETGESAWEKPAKRLATMVRAGMFGSSGMFAAAAAAGTQDGGADAGAYGDGQGAAAAAAEPEPVPEWQAVDDGEGNTYYFNEKTGESRWDPPPGFDGEVAVTAVGAAAVVKYSRSGVPLGDDWDMLEDEEGNVYYFNAASGMSQWDTPRPDGQPPPIGEEVAPG